MSYNSAHNSHIDSVEILAFYRSVFRALRFVEQRRPTDRRFGLEADAKWTSFKGDLTIVDRIDLMIRDADTEWPGAFGPRRVFGLRAASEDEPFGSEWAKLSGSLAFDIWREENSAEAPKDITAAFESIAAAWKVQLHPVEVPSIAPAEKLLVSGPSAIAAVALLFATGDGLAWHEQVLCVVEKGAHRQLATLAASIIHSPGSTHIVGNENDPVAKEIARRAIVSDDATDGELRLVEHFTGGEQE